MLENYLSNPICWPQQHLNVLELYQKTELSHVHCAVPQNALTVISLYVSNAVVEDSPYSGTEIPIQSSGHNIHLTAHDASIIEI